MLGYTKFLNGVVPSPIGRKIFHLILIWVRITMEDHSPLRRWRTLRHSYMNPTTPLLCLLAWIPSSRHMHELQRTMLLHSYVQQLQDQLSFTIYHAVLLLIIAIIHSTSVLLSQWLVYHCINWCMIMKLVPRVKHTLLLTKNVGGTLPVTTAKGTVDHNDYEPQHNTLV